MPTEPTQQLLVAYEDYSYATSSLVTGSNWNPIHPATNIVTSKYSEVAELASASSSISIDLGSAKALGIVCLPRHTLSITATWRVRLSNNVTLLTNPSAVAIQDIIYDSTEQVWPDTTDYTSVPYGEYTGWAGTIPDIYNPPALLFLPEGTTAQYLYLDIVDQIGSTISKLFIGPYWQPTHGISKNWGIAYVDQKKPKRLKGAAVLAEQTPRHKTVKMSCKYLTESEAFSNAASIDKVQGVNKPYLVIINPADKINRHRLLIYGTNKKLLPVQEVGAYGYYSKNFEIVEWL